MSQWLSPGKYYIDPDGVAVAGPFTQTNPEPADIVLPVNCRALNVGLEGVLWEGTYETLAPLVAAAEASNEETIRQVTQAGADGSTAQTSSSPQGAAGSSAEFGSGQPDGGSGQGEADA